VRLQSTDEKQMSFMVQLWSNKFGHADNVVTKLG